MTSTQMDAKASVPDLMLSLTRVIRAPRARVYEAWTNPDVVMQWMGPAHMRCPSATMDVRVGGAYRIDMVPVAPPVEGSPGTECGTRTSMATGHYTKVVPNEILQFTWVSAWQPDEETTVTIMLKDVPGGTELTLVHEKFTTEASRDGHNNGWAGSIEKLAALLEG